LTAPEFRAALKALGVSQKWLAERLGVDPVTVWRWAAGAMPVPQYAVFALELLAELEEAVDAS
jgi:transcriptional regulator with XRE-family HTH domain